MKNLFICFCLFIVCSISLLSKSFGSYSYAEILDYNGANYFYFIAEHDKMLTFNMIHPDTYKLYSKELTHINYLGTSNFYINDAHKYLKFENDGVTVVYNLENNTEVSDYSTIDFSLLKSVDYKSINQKGIYKDNIGCTRDLFDNAQILRVHLVEDTLSPKIFCTFPKFSFESVTAVAGHHNNKLYLNGILPNENKSMGVLNLDTEEFYDLTDLNKNFVKFLNDSLIVYKEAPNYYILNYKTKIVVDSIIMTEKTNFHSFPYYENIYAISDFSKTKIYSYPDKKLLYTLNLNPNKMSISEDFKYLLNLTNYGTLEMYTLNTQTEEISTNVIDQDVDDFSLNCKEYLKSTETWTRYSFGLTVDKYVLYKGLIDSEYNDKIQSIKIVKSPDNYLMEILPDESGWPTTYRPVDACDYEDTWGLIFPSYTDEPILRWGCSNTIFYDKECSYLSVDEPYTNHKNDDSYVFPNPATEQIKVKGLINGTNYISIYSLLGEKLSDYYIEISNNEFSIDISNLSNGTFLLNIQNGMNSITSKFNISR